MDPNENPPRLRSSGLRQPSKIPSPGRGLFEMTASANNARAATSMMPPPPEPISLKHKGSALPEPTPKRKTLAERAGESSRLTRGAPSNSQLMGSTVKATSLAGARNTSFSSSVSSRTPSSASSNGMSAQSFSSSIGPGSRPPSVQANRPPSAMAQTRASGQSVASVSRPASSQETHAAESERSASALGKRKAWDTKGRLEDMEYLYSELKEKMTGTTVERNGLEETLEIYKARVNELEGMRAQLFSNNSALQSELEETKSRLVASTRAYDDEHRNHGIEIGDLRRQHADEMVSTKRRADDEINQLRRSHRDELDDVERRLKNEIEELKVQRLRDVQTITAQTAVERQNAELELDSKARQLRCVNAELERVQGDLEQEKLLNQSLRGNISEASSETMTLESTIRSLKGRMEFLESDSKSQAQSFTDLEQRLQEASEAATETMEKLRKEESLRRKLHNQVQELKGNIRVFCRVRPSLESEPSIEAAKIAYPDAEKDMREVEVLGPEEKSSLGIVSTKKNAFAFDRVFSPTSQNEAVFEEISQLVQSALDGYNVCIFCYGQTGSGKTYTMSSEDGMIPRAVHQIYDTAQSLEEKGWSYAMEGSFVEVYNENLNDLLGRPEEFDKKKHEIRHDMQRCKTHVSDLTTVQLNSPAKVESILRRAMANRSVAATKANERSSRSHSVFMLRLTGENKLTGERSEGTLNLVDLAGSERLSHSGSTGDRLKETQNINRSLSCLGDVIGALGQGKEGGHVPYRNSKLTYLLQFSLGGNSKTLMFVMISPLQAHLSETLTSLKFATKVHNTHIGTAKRQAKIRDS